jgi:rhodanese-related sulfurtransferase
MQRAIEAAEFARLAESDEPYAMFDVREPMEYERGHIRGSTLLPRRQIEARIGDLVRRRDTQILLVDDDTGRAVIAARNLSALGYRNACALIGGVDAAANVGLTISTGTNVPSKHFGEEVQHAHEVPSVDAATLAVWKAEGRRMVICDVRTPEEYRENCIPDALTVPSFDIALHAQDLVSNHTSVIVNCAGRTRSIIGTRTLQELGHTNVYALENGLMGWILSGRQSERGAARHAMPASTASVTAAAVASRRLADAEHVGRINVDRLLDLLSQKELNYYLFDVRRQSDYEAGHIPGFQCLPGGQAVQRTDDFIAVRGAPIVLVDEHEAQANLAATWLRRMGYPDVAVLSGGLDAWRTSGGTLERGRSRAEPVGWQAAVARTCRLSVEAFTTALGSAPLVLDVDTSRHFRHGHVPSAIWMPRGWIELRISLLAKSADVPILLTCQSGRQSVYAACALKDLGYTRVAVLEGGTRSWAAAGRTLEPDASVPTQDDELLPPYKRGEQGMREYLAWEQRLKAPSH